MCARECIYLCAYGHGVWRLFKQRAYLPPVPPYTAYKPVFRGTAEIQKKKKMLKKRKAENSFGITHILSRTVLFSMKHGQTKSFNDKNELKCLVAMIQMEI